MRGCFLSHILFTYYHHMLLFCGSLCDLLFKSFLRTPKIIPAEPGQTNVTLPCRAPNNNVVIIVEWSRADLEEEYVLLFRDKRLNPDEQHPSFKNRVDLQDRQMKDGDVSLILKNVTVNDTGTYECRVVQREAKRRKKAVLKNEPISIVTLRVVPPGEGEAASWLLMFVSKDVVDETLAVEWSRDDLGDEYVLLYRNNKMDPVNQHPSFKNRVDLQDRQMKAGDVSLILKDVTINDTGTYKCGVIQEERGGLKLINTTYVHVVPPEEVILGRTGMTIALPCQVPSNNNPIVAVEWSRRDLEPEYVLFYQDNKLVPDYQHSSFKNRVDLQDRQMKGGDVSLILMDLTTDDAGAYECYVHPLFFSVIGCCCSDELVL
uniref:Ig-like domain-containing protein n=1 Tax=Maylandia zebra TaxID=106582 RepID=A0A3P9DBL4_9CICH